MTASGLYDQTTGTWLDVLATVDIDIDRAPRPSPGRSLAGRTARRRTRRHRPHQPDVGPGGPALVLVGGGRTRPCPAPLLVGPRSDALIDVLDSLPTEIDQHGMDRDAAVGVATTVATVGSTWIDGVPDSDAPRRCDGPPWNSPTAAHRPWRL